MKLESLLNTFENISDIALAYFDEKAEVLREISDQEDYFCVAPFSVQYKRLYIIGDLLYNNVFTISAKLDTEFQNQYEIKLKLGSIYNQVSDFDEASNSVSGYYKNLGHKYLNAVPLDVLVISNNLTEKSTSITFELSIDDEGSTISCAGNTSKVYIQELNLGDIEVEVQLDGESVGYLSNGQLPASLSSIFNYSLDNTGTNFIENVSNSDHSLYFYRSFQQVDGDVTNYSFISGEVDTSMCLKRKSYSYTILCTDPSYEIGFTLESAQAARYNTDIYVDDGFLCNLNYALNYRGSLLDNFSVYTSGSNLYISAYNYTYKVEFRARDPNGPKLVLDTETYYTETETSIITCLGGME